MTVLVLQINEFNLWELDDSIICSLFASGLPTKVSFIFVVHSRSITHMLQELEGKEKKFKKLLIYVLQTWPCHLRLIS